jgi:L-malate glycosyltransferase
MALPLAKRVLIVSSSPLNPAETFPSTFELTQARLLSCDYRVAILSVGIERYLAAGIRSLLRRFIVSPSRNDAKALWRLVVDLVNHFRGARTVKVHRIEGVTVYEGLASRFILQQGGDAEMRSWLAGANAAYAKYCTEEGKPDLIHAHGRFINAGVFALAIKKSSGIRYIYTEHSSYYHRGVTPVGTKELLNDIIAEAAAYCAVSPFLAETVASFLRRDDLRAIIIPNVFDEIFEREEPRALPSVGPIIFLNIASLYEHKGVEFVLRAFAEAFKSHSGHVLKFCGDGPKRAELEAVANELGVRGQVDFLGQLPKQEVLRQIDAAHAVVLGSAIETFGVALIEAMARGRPIIATRCGGPDTIVSQECGMLVETGNVAQMAAALKELVQNIGSYNPVEIRERALLRYGSKAFLSRMRAVYQTSLTGVL